MHTDGSFTDEPRQGGWGVVFSKRPKGAAHSDGEFIGCAWGSFAAFEPFCQDLQHLMDAHLMEALGLMWVAVAVLQLRVAGQVTFESDCQSALYSKQRACTKLAIILSARHRPPSIFACVLHSA